MYRMIYRFQGNWYDKKEGGETFDFETEKEIKHFLDSINWTNWRGEKLGYRYVSDKELEEECFSYAKTQAGIEMGEYL